jgi:hypothetical protein
MLLPVYAAFAAAIVFFVLIPIFGAFVLRGQWRRFRTLVSKLGSTPRLRYRDLAAAEREGGARSGRFRLHGTIEAIEGTDRIWVRGKEVSALVDLSRAPLYVLAPPSEESSAEPGSVSRIKWKSLSSLAEGTSVLVSGLLVLEEGRPVFVDDPGESLLAVCHDGGEEHLASRLLAAGRAPNEYWNYLTPISMAVGLVAISAILLLSEASMFPTLRALVFLAGIGPVLPFAPPGLAFFLLYRRLWRNALSARIVRDLLNLPLASAGDSGRGTYSRSVVAGNDSAPADAILIAAKERDKEKTRSFALFVPSDSSDTFAETFLVEGAPEIRARRAEREARLYAAASSLALCLAVFVNFALAFAILRAAL